jgi:hypothetical protein
MKPTPVHAITITPKYIDFFVLGFISLQPAFGTEVKKSAGLL